MSQQTETALEERLRNLAKDLITIINDDGRYACTSESGGVWTGEETEDLLMSFFRKVQNEQS